jgi:hypothetical protein
MTVQELESHRAVLLARGDTLRAKLDKNVRAVAACDKEIEEMRKREVAAK